MSHLFLHAVLCIALALSACSAESYRYRCLCLCIMWNQRKRVKQNKKYFERSTAEHTKYSNFDRSSTCVFCVAAPLATIATICRANGKICVFRKYLFVLLLYYSSQHKCSSHTYSRLLDVCVDVLVTERSDTAHHHHNDNRQSTPICVRAIWIFAYVLCNRLSIFDVSGSTVWWERMAKCDWQ